jgi:hypothetical protein
MNRIDEMNYDHAGQVIGVAMKVYSKPAPGFLESVYQNGLVIAHEVNVVNCLAATGIDEARLLNFGRRRLEFKKEVSPIAPGHRSLGSIPSNSVHSV